MPWSLKDILTFKKLNNFFFLNANSSLQYAEAVHNNRENRTF